MVQPAKFLRLTFWLLVSISLVACGSANSATPVVLPLQDATPLATGTADGSLSPEDTMGVLATALRDYFGDQALGGHTHYQTLYLFPRLIVPPGAKLSAKWDAPGPATPPSLVEALDGVADSVQITDDPEKVFDKKGSGRDMPQGTILVLLGEPKPGPDQTFSVPFQFYLNPMNGGGYVYTLARGSEGWLVKDKQRTWVS